MRSIAERQSYRDSVPKGPGVRRSFFVLSCHSSRNAISVPLWSDRTVKARAVGSGQTGLVMT